MTSAIILENVGGDVVPVDVYQKLSDNRILFLTGFLSDELANDLTATLLLKDAESQDEITLFINSDGGDVRNVLTLFDTMQIIQSPIKTVCIGGVSNEVVLLLAAGSPGLRFATKNSIISPSYLFHDRTYMTNLFDAKTMLNQFNIDNKVVLDNLAKCCKKKSAEVFKDFERKKFFNANQAKKYGIIDKIIQ